jgi:hypothetical protein
VLKDLQFTLYEVLGYLLPGCILLGSVWIVFHSCFWHDQPIVLWAELPAQALGCLLLAAYLAGHTAQGLGNLFKRLPFVDPDKSLLGLDPQLERALRIAASSRFGIDVEKYSLPQLFELCDEALVADGSLGEREVFTYREGFYRGCFVALSSLTLSLFVQVAYARIRASFGGRMVEMGRGTVFVAGLVCATSAGLALARYRRFAQYRTRRCLLRFLAPCTRDKRGAADMRS